MAYVGKITGTNGTTGLVASTLYGTCATAAATAAKVVTCSAFDKLMTGVTIHVKFTYSNTATSPTLNVNSTGAKNIYRNGTTAVGSSEGTSWVAGAVLSFTYDGSAWVMNDSCSFPLAHTHPDQDIKWGTANLTGSYNFLDGLMNQFLSPNRFAGAKADGITIEYSNDAGSTWTTYPNLTATQKSNIFTNRATSVRIGGPTSVTPTVSADSQLRITVNTGTAQIYTTISKIHIYISTSYSQNCKVTIKAATHGDPTNFSKIICNNHPISGWSGWNVVAGSFTTYGNTDVQYQYIQFTFTHTGTTEGKETSGLQVTSIMGFGGVGWTCPSQLAQSGHVYSFDGLMCTTFPNTITISSGGLTVSSGGITVNGGVIKVLGNQSTDSYSGALNMNNSNIYGLNSIYTADASDDAGEGFHFYRTTTTVDTFRVASGKMYFYANRTLGQKPNPTGVVLHTGNTTVTQTLTSGTAIGSISLDGTSTTLYAPTPTVNTDENVKQSVSTTTDYRPIALGKHTWTTGSIPSTDPTTVTDQIYGTSNLYVKPSTGSLLTKGYLECVTNNSGLWLTDSSNAEFASVFCGSNFWVGAANSSDRSHVGVTYISTGYDSTNSCGYSTIFVSIPNADNTGQSESWGVLHKGNTSVTQVLSSGTKIATISLGATSTDLYAPTNTDTKVNVTLATTTKAYLLGTSTTPTGTAQAVTSVGDTGVFLTTTAGRLQAGTYAITSGSYAHILKPGSTNLSANAEHTFPNTGGTVLNTGTTSYTADANAPTSSTTGAYAIGTLKINGSSYSIYGKDTNTWTAMTGATSSANGSVGYINSTPPKDGYNTKFWRADGSWAVPTNTTYGLSGAYGGTGNSTWVTTLTAGGSGTTSTVPTASTSVYGITKLSDSTSSTSTALAATANSVKTAYDLADGKSVVTASTSTVSGATTIKSIKIDNTNYNIYDSGNTDTKVNVTLATTSKAYLLATTTAPTSSAQAVTSVGDTGVYLTTSAGVLHATTFEGSLNGTITVTETHGNGTTPTTQKTYYVPFMVDKESTNYILANDGIRYATYDGDTSASPKTPGIGSLRLGNNKTVDDAGNMRGSILMFGSGANYVQVLPTTLTSDRTIYFPDEGGTIALKTQADTNEMINLLSEGTSIPSDNDFYVSQFANGGTTTTTYHRRSVLALWQYMASKMTNGSNVSFSTDSTTKVLTISASNDKVTSTALGASTAEATYYPTFSTSSSTNTAGLNKISSFKVIHTPGTTSAVGNTRIILGNTTASGTANNEEGLIRLYSSGTSYHTFQVAATNTSGGITHTFPATAGTVLNTGTTSFTQTQTSGTKIGSIKINNTSTDIYSPTVGLYSIIGTIEDDPAYGSHATCNWGGSIPVAALYDGLTIAYCLQTSVSPSANVTLNLKLSNGTYTGRVNAYTTASSRITTHYGAGSTIILTYWSAGSISVDGTVTTVPRWARADYNSNTDTKVTQSVLATTVTNSYPLLLSYYTQGVTTTTAQTSNRIQAIYAQPSTGIITANGFEIATQTELDSKSVSGGNSVTLTNSNLGRYSIIMLVLVNSGTDDTYYRAQMIPYKWLKSTFTNASMKYHIDLLDTLTGGSAYISGSSLLATQITIGLASGSWPSGYSTLKLIGVM